MHYLITMALRNTRRNTRRSLLAILSLTLVIMFIVCIQGFTGGLLGSIVKNYTKNETGHIRITTATFQEKYRFKPVTENIKNPAAIIAAIRNNPQIAQHLAVITERISCGVLLSHNGNTASAYALAGDPVVEEQLLLLNRALLPGGRYLLHERETIIGAGIAKKLGYTVGDTLAVMTPGSDYALHLRKLTIVGIFASGLSMLDDGVFQISLTDAKALLRMHDATQQIIIMLDRYKRAEQVANEITALLHDTSLAVTPWSAIGDYGRMVQYTGAIYTLIYFVVALLGAFIIGNIMMMVVLERRHEIGLLKSMGLRKGEVLVLFITEGLTLGTIGSVLGIIVGLGISLIFHFHGIDFTKALGSVTMPLDNVIYFTIRGSGVLQAFIIGTVVSVLVSLLPAWQAARMHPVAAIKSV